MTYETNKQIPSLSSVRKDERLEREDIFRKEELDLLVRCVSFYDREYPKSKFNKSWTRQRDKFDLKKVVNIDEYLDELTEPELEGVSYLLLYAHDEREIVNIPDHDKMNRINAKVRKLIPGGAYIEKIYKLRNAREGVEKELKELEDRLERDRAEFYKKHNINVSFTCQWCDRELKTEAGHQNHEKICRKNPENVQQNEAA